MSVVVILRHALRSASDEGSRATKGLLTRPVWLDRGYARVSKQVLRFAQDD